MKELDKNIKRKYSILDYNPQWPAQFEVIKKHISEIFKDKALQIEHVGSTSIPGMKAKPLIDVLVVVQDIDQLSTEIVAMNQAGYEWAENYIAPRSFLFYKTASDGQKLENIHVCEVGAPKVRQFIIMRDFLRAFPEKAQQYATLKELYYKAHPDDYPAYRAAKAPFLSQIEKEAYDWELVRVR